MKRPASRYEQPKHLNDYSLRAISVASLNQVSQWRRNAQFNAAFQQRKITPGALHGMRVQLATLRTLRCGTP